MLRFEFNGKPFDPKTFEESLLAQVMEAAVSNVRGRIESIRHPETGEFPTVVASATSLEDITVRVEGSPELLKLVNERLRDGEGETAAPDDMNKPPQEGASARTPHVFLSFAYENRPLAEQIAKAMMANGIQVWWSEWEIRAGDSLRQRIEEGIEGCTHFVVLLTPQSIVKPWVNLEMDAGLIQKLAAKATFIPLRHALPHSALPALLKPLLSPEVVDPCDEAFRQVINDIHGVSRRPPLGPTPSAAAHKTGNFSGYSPAAAKVAEVFVRASTNAQFGHPQLSYEELAGQTGLTTDDVRDALFELRGMLTTHHDSFAYPEPSLFANFDGYFCEWKPAEDALRLAAELVNGQDHRVGPSTLAERFGWAARRMNPAIAYLEERDAIHTLQALGTGDWICHVIEKTDATRRFVRSRSIAGA